LRTSDPYRGAAQAREVPPVRVDVVPRSHIGFSTLRHRGPATGSGRSTTAGPVSVGRGDQDTDAAGRNAGESQTERHERTAVRSV